MFENKISKNKELVYVFGLYIFLVICYFFIFGQLYPTKNGTLGHDWNIGGYLQYYFRMEVNPWSFFRVDASPASCNSQLGVGLGFPYHFTDLLILSGVSPINVVRANILFLVTAAFWGTYFLLRYAFRMDWRIAALAAALFMFNGLTAYRYAIGHNYGAFALIPLMAILLVTRHGFQAPKHMRWLTEGALGIAAGILAFYMLTIYSLLAIAAWVGLGISFLIVLWWGAGGHLRWPVIRSLIGFVTLLGLSYFSLNQIFNSSAFAVAVAQRQSYALPGITSVWDALRFLALALFISPADISDTYNTIITNMSVPQERHELEYGVSIVPALMLLLGGAWRVWVWVNKEVWSEVPWEKWIPSAIFIALILLVPICYTVQSDSLQAWFKALPFFGQTTSPQRIYMLYTLAVIIGAAVIINEPGLERFRSPMLVGGIFILLMQNALTNKDFYQAQAYDTKPVMSAHQALMQGKPLPAITRIAVLTDAKGLAAHDQMVEANLFLQGVQHMGCYVPGYSSVPLELIKTLQPGSIWTVTDGRLNIKNPACNSFPRENNCMPGDHFSVGEKSLVDAYVNYRYVPFAISEKQKNANEVTRLSIIFLVLYILFYFGVAWRSRKAWERWAE